MTMLVGHESDHANCSLGHKVASQHMSVIKAMLERFYKWL